MSLQMDRSREKLARCRTERELNATQREIEELRKLYRDRELEIEKINGLAEQARAEMDGANTERQALMGDLAKDHQVVSRLDSLEKDVSSEREQRKELVKVVPPALYRRYEMIRKRRGSALAWTFQGTCSACHISLSPMTFQRLRRGEDFDQCPSCQRILYYREEAAASDSSEESAGSETST
jgi:predicted  nucleic acid-binding Zn-ribbon protein